MITLNHALNGRRVALRPLTPMDIPHIYRMAMHPDSLNRWRLAGHMPTLEQFWGFLTREEELSVSVDDYNTGKITGLGQCYDVDLTNGRASFAVIADPERHRTPAIGEAHQLLVEYFFDVLPINKLCAEIPEFNWPSLLRSDGSLRGWESEGVHRRHVFRGGRYWDVACFARFSPLRAPEQLSGPTSA